MKDMKTLFSVKTGKYYSVEDETLLIKYKANNTFDFYLLNEMQQKVLSFDNLSEIYNESYNMANIWFSQRGGEGKIYINYPQLICHRNDDLQGSDAHKNFKIKYGEDAQRLYDKLYHFASDYMTIYDRKLNEFFIFTNAKTEITFCDKKTYRTARGEYSKSSNETIKADLLVEFYKKINQQENDFDKIISMLINN